MQLHGHPRPPSSRPQEYMTIELVLIIPMLLSGPPGCDRSVGSSTALSSRSLYYLNLHSVALLASAETVQETTLPPTDSSTKILTILTACLGHSYPSRQPP